MMVSSGLGQGRVLRGVWGDSVFGSMRRVDELSSVKNAFGEGDWATTCSHLRVERTSPVAYLRPLLMNTSETRLAREQKGGGATAT